MVARPLGQALARRGSRFGCKFLRSGAVKVRHGGGATCAAALLAALLTPVASAAPGTSSSAGKGLPPLVVNRAQTYEVAQEIGPGSINNTAVRWDVYGADLGSMFTFGHRLYIVFGDTFGGPAANPFFSVDHANWRSNTMAFVNSQTEPDRGLRFSGMITGRDGTAEELLSSKKVDGVEETVIPTYGTGVDGSMYLFYMSVQEYGAPGHWTCNYSGVAHSTDNGQHWAKDPNVTWGGDSNFGQVALVKNGSFVYVFGIPCGRYGRLELARAPQSDLLHKASYQYWGGHGWVPAPSAAEPLVNPPVGELSVEWNSFYRRWLMMYLVDPTGQIVLRTATKLTGPWSSAQVVVTSAKYPELYAPYITPEWDNGPGIYFDMSMYGPYHVVLMHTELTGA
jgi:hypothetical protein